MECLKSEVKCLGEYDDKKLIEMAVEYLQPVKLIDVQIASIKEEINQLRANLTSIGAIDYSKDRVSGGGTPQGLEVSIAKFMDTADKRNKKIERLAELKCDAITLIDSLDEKLGAVILRYEYILNTTTEDAYKMIGNYSTKQAKRYKQRALIECGEKLSVNVRKCPQMSV